MTSGQPGQWPQAEADRVAALTLLVVRAGAKDSLAWWDDESLTPAGAFVLERIFPRDPRGVALRLAIRAAREKHAGVLASAGVSERVTLFDLPSAVDSLAGLPRDLDEPITSADELRGRLVAVAPEIEAIDLPEASSSGLLDLTASAGQPGRSVEERATVLAAGYLQARRMTKSSRRATTCGACSARTSSARARERVSRTSCRSSANASVTTRR